MRTLLASSLWLALCACDEVVPTTQIIIVVNLDSEVKGLADHLLVELTPAEADEPSVREIELRGADAPGLPLSFSLVPGIDSPGGRVVVTAIGEDGEEIVSRAMELLFRSRRTVSYGVLLSAECIASTCDDQCIDCGQCGASEVDPEEYVVLSRASDAVARWEPRLSCGSATDAGGEGASEP